MRADCDAEGERLRDAQWLLAELHRRWLGGIPVPRWLGVKVADWLDGGRVASGCPTGEKAGPP